MKALKLSHSIARCVLAMALAAPVMVPRVATAQSQPSLAEIARQEAERRKTVKDSKRVITAKDLPESARKPASTPEGSAAAAGGDQKPAADAGAGGQSPAPAASGGDEASWRGRMSQARGEVRRNEVFVQALQTRVNALGNDFRNGAGDFTQQAQVNADKQTALQELERVKADLELSKKRVADIEEEARKAGVPPGWVR